MPDLPLRTDLFNLGADEIRARTEARPPALRVDPEQVFVEGSDLNVITASASAMGEEVTRQLSRSVGALLLDGATGEDLDRLVADRFSPTIVRRGASPAVVTLQFSRVAGAFAAITIPVGFQVRSTSGVVFETTTASGLGAGAAGPVDVPAQAVLAGLGGNVPAGTITQIATLPAPDPNLLVTNAERAAGGDDPESDVRLRARARNFYLQARRGTVGAIEFGALTVPGIRQATAIEELDAFGRPTGRVALYLADAQGQANAALVAAVRAALYEYRAAGVVVDIYGATPRYVPIIFRLRFEAAVDTVAAFDNVRFATVATVNTLAPGATLPVSLLFAVARSVRGVIVLEDAIVAPVGDLVPAAGEVLRTTIDLVSEA